MNETNHPAAGPEPQDGPAPGPQAGSPPGSQTGSQAGSQAGAQSGAQATAQAGADPGVDWQQVRRVHRLQRPADRMVAGVSAGLGRHFDIDPLVVRVAFGVLVFFGGAGLLLYGALWLLLPEEGHDRAPLHLDERTRGVALVGVAVLAALALVGDSWGLYWFPWPLAVLAVIAWVLYARRPEAVPAAAPYAAPPHTSPAYAPPAGAPPAYAPPAHTPPAYAPPPPPRRRDPRRRGPLLFGFTLALVVLAMGVLGTADLAGVAVIDSAYPATATAICAAMLLVGAFWGRAGGIIALGLVAALLTAGVMTVERWDDGSGRIEAIPGSTVEVRDLYELRRGDLSLDLTRVDDLAALDGRQIRLEAGVGRILLVLPEDLGVDLVAEVGGPGSIRLPEGSERGGIAVSTDTLVGPSEAPRLEVRAELGVGEIKVVQR